MNEKAKYVAILFLALLISATTSYLTTLSLHSNSQSTSSNSIEANQQPTSVKIFPLYNVSFLSVGDCRVTVYSNVPLYNLTMDYRYTTPNDITLTSNVTYGDYFPSWGPSTIIVEGETPYAIYAIPQDIIQACSTTTYNAAEGITVFVIPPQLTVTVYGFS